MKTVGGKRRIGSESGQFRFVAAIHNLVHIESLTAGGLVAHIGTVRPESA